MVTFSDKPTSARIWNTQFGKDGYKIQNKAAATFLIDFGAQLNVGFIMKAKIFVLIIEWVIWALKLIVLTSASRMIIVFWARSPMFLNTCLYDIYSSRPTKSHTIQI